jgi:glutaredoxin 3
MKDLKDIIIYTKKYCSYCINLEKFLIKSGYKFENISVDGNIKLYNELKNKTNHYTVPQVFIGGQFIGGSDDFLEYYHSLDVDQKQEKR